MGFFETIYSWGHSFFNSYLWDTLRVIDNEDGETLYADSLFVVGIISIVLTLLVAVFYYKIYDHPKFKSWWSWLITLSVAAMINFAVGIGMAYWRVNDVNASEEACELILGDEYEDDVYLGDFMSSADYCGFGMDNVLFSSLFFVVFSLPLMFMGKNTKYSPFRM